MYYKWKDAYNTFGLDGIKPHKTRIGYYIKKLKSENKRLKKLLAERYPYNALPGESIKNIGKK